MYMTFSLRQVGINKFFSRKGQERVVSGFVTETMMITCLCYSVPFISFFLAMLPVIICMRNK